MLAQVALAFLPVIITNEGREAHIDEGSFVSYMDRHMTTVDAFHDKDNYLVASRSAEGASAFDAKGCKFPAACLYRPLVLGCRCIITHYLCAFLSCSQPRRAGLVFVLEFAVSTQRLHRSSFRRALHRTRS